MLKIVRRLMTIDLRVKGFYSTRARWWMNVIDHDEKFNPAYTKAEKKWAYRHGFIPAVAERYQINESNVDDFISIKDYCHIYPVNDIFRKWVKDRVTTRNVLKPYKEYLPETYFHLYKRDGSAMIIRLLDCPEGYEDTFSGILALIRDKGVVNLAKSTGIVNTVLRYENGTYYYNAEAVAEKELIGRLTDTLNASICVIVEHVNEHEQFSAGHDGCPTILRLMVYNKYADNPKIGQAYLRYNGQSGLANAPMSEMGERIGNNIQEFTDKNNQNQIEIEVNDGVYEKNFLEDQIVLPKAGKKVEISRFVYVPVDLEDGSYHGGKQLDETNHIVSVTEDPLTGKELSGTVPFWREINEQIQNICNYMPQLEYIGVDVIITENGFKMVDFTDHPYYPQVLGFNEEMTDYLKLKVSQIKEKVKDPEFRKANFKTKSDAFLWVRLAKLFCPPAMRPLIYKWWYITVKADLFSRNGISLKDKIWAYKQGFLSYRIPQYGITRENYKSFISDYDYRYLRHINNKYRVWLEDKITVKYICDRFSQFFPKYYYHISVRNGEKRVIPLMDLPDYCTNDLSSVFELVQNAGALACKPQRGSQGQGFYKLSYHDGKYYLNHQEASKEEVLAILNDPEKQYLITEYIQQHPVINKIYPGAVNTLRIITFMRDGKTPEMGNAYMRFGSQKTGAVDNMGAGGMFVQVDMETGRFYNGKIITENSILPCSNHPDTGELIEGYLPNWDIVKQGIMDLCLEMPQLEYLGFDVAITEDGMKLPEINRAPGYPKIETFNRKTIDYLLYKREVKMKKNNIQKTKW